MGPGRSGVVVPSRPSPSGDREAAPRFVPGRRRHGMSARGGWVLVDQLSSSPRALLSVRGLRGRALVRPGAVPTRQFREQTDGSWSAKCRPLLAPFFVRGMRGRLWVRPGAKPARNEREGRMDSGQAGVVFPLRPPSRRRPGRRPVGKGARGGDGARSTREAFSPRAKPTIAAGGCIGSEPRRTFFYLFRMGGGPWPPPIRNK